MKTVTEIRESIEETKYRLSKMKKPEKWYDEEFDTGLAEMGGWISALEWVIGDEVIPISPEDLKRIAEDPDLEEANL